MYNELYSGSCLRYLKDILGDDPFGRIMIAQVKTGEIKFRHAIV